MNLPNHTLNPNRFLMHRSVTSCTVSACLLAALCAAAPSHAGGDGEGPITANAGVVRDLLAEAATRRIDIVQLGDSNQLFSSVGWQDGWTVALGERYPMYATPLLGAGDNKDIGIALNTMASASMPPSGAPSPLLAYSFPSQGVDVTPYAYLPDGQMIAGGSNIGMRFSTHNAKWSQNNFDIESNLRFHFDYGTFDVAPGAVFQPGISQPGGFSPTHAPISPQTGAFGIASSFIDLPAAVRTSGDIRFRWFASGAPDGVGPVHALYMRVEDTDQLAGQSVSTLFGVGGATARDCAMALRTTPEEQLRTFFERIRDKQAGDKKILVRIAFGANDFTELDFSIGPDAPQPGGTGAAVADNTREIIAQINEVWTLAGWDHSELVFLLVGCHERLEPEPDPYGFRQALSEVTADAPNIAFVNHYRLATKPEMLSSGWYDFPTGAHLSTLGYEVISRFELQAIDRQLTADINGDCVVDTADLGLLLSDFGSVGARTDLNLDRFIDTADLGILLAQFGTVCD